MIFLNSGIFICVQSRASISTLALAQQCHCDFAEPVPTSGPSILWCVYGRTNIMRRFSDLRGDGGSWRESPETDREVGGEA